MRATTNYPLWALALLAGVLGACFASFLDVVTERLPRRRSLGGRSTCVCGRQLRAWENVPVISWIALRGRSSCCHVAIPRFYVLSEAALAMLFALALLPGSLVVMLTLDVFGLYLLVLVGWYRTTNSLNHPAPPPQQ